MPKPSTPLNRDAIAKRIQDDVRGIHNPAVDFGSPSTSKQKAQPAPDVLELGIPVAVRKRLERMITASLKEAKEIAELVTNGGIGHLGLGLIERAAKKLKDPLTEEIRELAAEEIGLADETPCFSIQGVRVARYVTYRESFDKEVLKLALLRLGVQPSVINTAMTEASSKKPVHNLRISEGGGESE